MIGESFLMRHVTTTPDAVSTLSGAAAKASLQPITGLSIGQYLIRRLQDYGVRHVFGIPGDYVLAFYKMLSDSPIELVGCTREDCAGFAADAYARVNGMGAVCVTYCVGGLSLCNSIAGAYAEKSPVVVISGAPGLGERINNPLLHHKVRDFHTQADVFEKICVAGAELDDPQEAFREIDRVLDAAARLKRPVYLELPRDMVDVVPDKPYQFRLDEAKSDPEALAEAVDEAARWISSCQKAVIIAGVEIHRFGLQDDVLALAEGSHIGIAATMLGKSVISEVHPLYVGLYEGALGREEVTRFVEESDCVILLGTFMTDINLGIYTANLDPAKCIYATSEQLRIRHHHFHGVQLGDFIRALAARRPQPPLRELPPRPQSGKVRRSARCAGHDSTADRAPERNAERPNGGDRRYRRFAVCRHRTCGARTNRVHFPGLLHIDGLLRAGGTGGASGSPRSACSRYRRRRCVSNDGNGTVDAHSAPFSHDHHTARQRRLWHRAVLAPELSIQRYSGVAVSQIAGRSWWRNRLRNPHRRRIGRRPQARLGRHQRPELVARADRPSRY